MNFSFDVIEDTDVFTASIVKDKGPETTSFDSDPRLAEEKPLPDHLENPDAAALSLLYPTLIARLGANSTPTSLHILKGLGEGTMGRVFLTRDSRTSKVFALKAITKSHAIACGELEHVVAERGCLAENFDNPFTVHLNASFQDETRLYMLLDFCAGGDLATELTRWGGRMPTENVMYNIAHLVEGIASLHEMGIIHRDLKPENILLTARGHIKISDFGSALRVHTHDSWIEIMTDFGTIAYVSPEVFDGYHNFTMDWWSLGVIIYEMVLGKHPFLSDATHSDGSVDMEDLTEAICNCEYSLPKDMQPLTRRIIRGFLRADPTRRYGAEDVRKSALFTGWDWDMVRTLGYQPPQPPVINARDATCNFDPEFNNMYLEDDENIEGIDSLDDPSLFSGFDLTPALEDTYSTTKKIPVTHTQRSQHSLVSSMHSSSYRRGADAEIYSPPSTTNIIVGKEQRNTWKILKACFAAVTQFKRGTSRNGKMIHSRNL